MAPAMLVQDSAFAESIMSKILKLDLWKFALSLDNGNMKAQLEIKATVLSKPQKFKMKLELNLGAIAKYIFDHAMAFFKNIGKAVVESAKKLFNDAKKRINRVIESCKQIPRQAAAAANAIKEKLRAAAAAAAAAETAAKKAAEVSAKAVESTAKQTERTAKQVAE